MVIGTAGWLVLLLSYFLFAFLVGAEKGWYAWLDEWFGGIVLFLSSALPLGYFFQWLFKLTDIAKMSCVWRPITTTAIVVWVTLPAILVAWPVMASFIDTHHDFTAAPAIVWWAVGAIAAGFEEVGTGKKPDLAP